MPASPHLAAPRHRLLVWVFGQMDKRGSFEDYVLSLARRAHECDLGLDVVAGPGCEPTLRADLEATGATMTCLPIAERDSVACFAREMLRRRPTLVHCHFGSPSTVLAPIARLLGARGFVFTDHGSRTVVEPVREARFSLRRARRQVQAAFIDRWLPVSAFVGTMLEREVAAPAARVRTLFNGIDLARARRADSEGQAAIRARLGLAPDARVALFVGNLCAEKGVPDLLAVQDEVLAADPRNVMVWAGDGVLRDEVQRTAGPRVHVLGRRNDVPELQCAADLLVAPSRWYEAFSLVLAEAAACGRPAIAARIGGIPEVVQDGQTGMLFEPGDRAALAANLIDLLRDGALRTSLGAAARCRADALFSLDHMVSATIDEYRNLLKGPASTPTATSLVRSAHA